MWLVAALGGYVLNAVANLFDKDIVSKRVKSPFVFASLVTVGGGITILAFPWSSGVPSWTLLLLSLIVAGGFFAGLYYYYLGLSRGHVAYVAPTLGALQTLGIFIISFFLLYTRYTVIDIFALLLLMAGAFLLAREGVDEGDGESRNDRHWFFPIVISSLCFALSFTVGKYLYAALGYVDGVIWPRVMGVVIVALCMIHPRLRALMHQDTTTRGKRKRWGIVVLGQVCGAGGFLLVQYGVSSGSVALVNALTGVQYCAVIAFSWLLHIIAPGYRVNTPTHSPLLWGASGLIALGVALLAFDALV